MAELKAKSFFSVGFDLVLVDENLPYDLYINSSSHETNEKFVRIFPKNGRLCEEDLKGFKGKYHQLYILESQRSAYLKSLVKKKDASPVTKTEIIKDSAILYLDKLFDEEKEFNTEILEEAIEGCRESVEAMVEVVKDFDITEVQNLIGSLSFHDFYTYDHSINVSMYCISLFRALKPDATDLEITMAGLGGLLHDLGKIQIPTQIINNPGKLSDEDFEMIKKHPEFGNELLDGHTDCGGDDVNWDIIRRVILEHHENVNGTGYPKKLKDEEIHVMAKVTSIADFFDAITTKRSYHDVLSTEDALEVMAKSVGRKIDPKIFEIFTRNASKIVLKGKGNQELPDDFDACKPHNVLPLQKVEANLKEKNFFKKEDQDFGKVSQAKESTKKKSKSKKKKKAA
ncbi:MAG: HD domain-containing protein [Halobacteriovoraceae bacterium]|jgi:HD-GYP domain-containing protein (c-di-GMP phosphodiesterase class II)|nr:HD domain-containing protein [Halobacteriovoraceae bacterium]MBT5093741.1 HD domain-containing protein [Halobacteriovoraceae bacterium]